MERHTEFHSITECPSCEEYWRRTGRQTVGFVDYSTDDTCPSCQAS
jgi:hypothetical protein